MGYNTTILLLNDGLGQIEQDKEIGQNISDAVAAHFSNRFSTSTLAARGHIIVFSGNHGNPIAIVEQQHSSDTSIIAVGQNTAQTIAVLYNEPSVKYNETKEEGQERLLMALAKHLGYTVTKD